jgi:hypothetical protein
MEYIKAHKKIKWFGEHLIRKKPTSPQVLFEWFDI